MSFCRKNVEGLQAICNGCGSCAGICPNDAVEMRKSVGGYVPLVKKPV